MELSKRGSLAKPVPSSKNGKDSALVFKIRIGLAWRTSDRLRSYFFEVKSCLHSLMVSRNEST